MALRPINSDGGFSTGANNTTVIDSNANITANNLSVTGESNLGNISNVVVTGGSNGQVISTDGSGNLSFANLSNSANTQIIFNNNGTLTGSNALTFVNDVVVANGGIDIIGDLYLSGNSAIRAAGNITVTADTEFDGNITGGNANITNIRGDIANFNTGNISSLVTVGANLGNVTSLKILGGVNGQFLQTDGSGNLAWSAAGGGSAVANQASINFTANSNANNQQFSSGSLSVFPSNAYASVFKNGVLIDVDDYTIANGVLVINTYLQTDDRITVGALLSPEATPNGSNQQIQFNNQGNMGASGALKFDSDSDTLILIGTQRYVDDSGRYAAFKAFNLDSNVTYNLPLSDGSNGQVLSTDGAGNLSWANGGGGGSSIANGNSNVRIATANGNVTVSVGGVSEVLTVSNTGATVAGSLAVTATSNLGEVGNVKITGGSNGQVISTDGNGNLSFISVSSSSISNGNSNVRIATANGNATISVAGNANIVTVTGTGASIAGTLNVTGNTTLSNLTASERVTANSVVVASNGNLTVSGTSSLTGNVTANTNLTVLGNANVGGNLVTANANVSGTLGVTGNANTGNLGTGTLIATTGNITTVNTGLVQNGNSNIAITANGNMNFTVGGTANVLRLSNTGVNVAGTLTTNGTATMNTINATTLNVSGAVSFNANTSFDTNIFLGNISFIKMDGGSEGQVLTKGSGNNVSFSNPYSWVKGGLFNGAVPVVANESNSYIIWFYPGTLSEVGGSNQYRLNVNSSNLHFFRTDFTNTFTYFSVSNTSFNIYNNLISNGSVDFTTSPNVSLGAVGNVKITGGSNGQYLQTDGAGNLSFATINTDSISNGASNVTIPAFNGNVLIGVAGFSNIFVASPSGISVTGAANISGNVTAANANLGNLVTANFVTGTLTTAAQPNITSVGTLSSLQVTGNITGNANVVSDNVIARTGTLTLSATGSNQDIDLKPTGNGVVDVWTARISNVADPTAAQDVATKAYVDAAVESLHVHDSCVVATPDTLANITGGTTTYDNGIDGVGAYIETTGTFGDIDGVNVATVGTRILVKSEDDAAWNGIYTYTNATAITRAEDFNTSADAAGGDFVFITSGNTYADTGWVQTTDNVVMGTSNIVWTQFSGAGQYSAGTGLTLDGTVFSISNTTVTANSYGNGDRVATFTVNSQGQLTAAANAVITANAANLIGNTLNANIVTSSLTSVGNLNGLTVSNGNIFFGGANNVWLGATEANLRIPGGSNGQVLKYNSSNVLAGNVVWGNIDSVAANGASMSIDANGNIFFRYLSNITAAIRTTSSFDISAPFTYANNLQLSGKILGSNIYNVSNGSLTYANFQPSNITLGTDNQFATGRALLTLSESGIIANAAGFIIAGTTGRSIFYGNVAIPGNNFVANSISSPYSDGFAFTPGNGAMNFYSNGDAIGFKAGNVANVVTITNSNTTIANSNLILTSGNVTLTSGGITVTNGNVTLSNANSRFVGGLTGNIFGAADPANISITTANTYGSGSNKLGMTFDLSNAAANGNMSIEQTSDNKVVMSVPYIQTSDIYSPTGVTATDLTLTATSNFNQVKINVFTATKLAVNSTAVTANANLVVSNTLTANGTINFTNSANVSLGAVGNVKITGGTSGQVLSTDGVGNLSFVSVSTSSISNGNSNVAVDANSNVTISAAGNANIVTVTGTGANIAGDLAVSGNVSFTGANVALGGNGNVRITGGSSGQYLQTDGSGGLSWVTISGGAAIVNGNSNVTVAANSNVTVGVAGNANIVTVTGTGANVSGTANITGNVALGSNLTVAGNANVTGNLTAGNLIGHLANGNSSVKIATANGNVTITANGNANIVTVTGTGANVSGTLNVTGNVTFTGADVNLGNISNLEILGGGLFGQSLISNGANGAQWANTVVVTAQFLRGSRAANANITSNSVVVFDTNDYSTGSASTLDTTTGNITLQPGTYILKAQVPAAAMGNTSAGQRPLFQWFNATSNTWLGSGSAVYQPNDGAGWIASGGLAEAVVTLTTASNVQFRLRSVTSGNVQLNQNVDFTSGSTRPWFEVSSPGGQASGLVQYLYATRSGNQTIPSGTWANRDIVFNSVAENSGLTYNASTGEVTLNAGVTYRITAGIQWGALASYLYPYAVYNNANVRLSGIFEAWPTTSSTNNVGPQQVDFIYTPPTTTTVKIRTTSGANAAGGEVVRGDLGGTFLSVQSITNPSYQTTGGWVTNNTWTFGATTTAPTMATTNTKSMSYNVNGKVMQLKAYYNHTSNVGATAGTGEYLITIPGGYTIDTATTGTAATGVQIGLPLGRVYIDDTDGTGTYIGDGIVLAYDSTRIKFITPYYGSFAGNGAPMSPSRFPLNASRMFFTIDCQIPLV